MVWYAYLGGLIGLMVIGYIVYDWTKYKHTFVARIETKNRQYVLRTKAKEFQQDGQTMWKLLKKSIVPVLKGVIHAPSDAADIDNKGRMWAEAIVTDGAQVTYIQHNKDKQSFDPIPREERVAFLNQLKKAQADKPLDRFGQVLQLAPMALLALIVIIGLVFAGDVLSAYTDMHTTTTKSVVSVMDQAERIVAKIDKIENNIQVIEKEEISLPLENENT